MSAEQDDKRTDSAAVSGDEFEHATLTSGAAQTDDDLTAPLDLDDAVGVSSADVDSDAASHSSTDAGSNEATDVELTQPLEGFASLDEPREPSSTPENNDERSAAAHLRDGERLDDWTARAEWFENQAETDHDVKRKARTLTVASELWAMAGNTEQAAATASRAAKLGSPVGQRQARQLAASAGNTAAVLGALGAETVAANTTAARAHAAFYAAEVTRLSTHDSSAALKYWDLGAKQAPKDLRPQLFKLIKQLGGSGRAPSLRFGEDAEHRVLSEATAELAVARGEAPRNSEQNPLRPVSAFIAAGRALREGKRTTAADLLLQLAQQPEFSRAARWLATALLAQSSDTRARSASLLSDLLKEKGSAALRRVLAARALELGDNGSATLALEHDSADENADLAFTAADHIAIGALCGAEPELLRTWLDAAKQQEDLGPLVAAVTSAFGLKSTEVRETQAAPSQPLADGAPSGASGENTSSVYSATAPAPSSGSVDASPSDESSTDELVERISSGFADRESAPVEGDPSEEALALALGNALGTSETLDALLESARPEHASNEHPLLHLIRLESALERQDIDAIARALVNGPTTAPNDDPHQAHYAAGLLYERFGKSELADQHYGRALRSNTFGEAAARALMKRLPRERASQLLSTLATQVGDSEHRALLLLEAALCETSNEARQDLCRAAHDADPSLALTSHLGESCAARANDLEERQRWIERQLSRTRDPAQRCLLLLRDALLEKSAEKRTARIVAAWELWPKDIALGRLLDAQETLSPADRAELRCELTALAADDVTRTQLWLEAAWLFEDAGDRARAAAAAEKAEATQPLAQLCSLRTAAGQHQATHVRATLEKQIESASSPTHAAASCLQLADFEARCGDPQRQLELLTRAVDHAPKSLVALAQLEAKALAENSNTHALRAATGLMNQLQGDDAVPHALLAARFERLENGWNAAYPVLERSNRGPKTPPIIARHLLSHARVLGANQVAYDMTCALQTNASQPIDKAILCLRAAELALRLDREEKALVHLRDALAIHPGYIPALSTYAQVLSETGHQVRAAEAYELLARRSRVVAHQVSHWHRAAELWLDEVGDSDRALHALQHASRVDPTHPAVFDKLREIYTKAQQFEKLEALIDARLAVTTERDEVAALQLAKSHALVASGRSQPARQALLAVIKASPENVEALTTLADLSERDGDALSAEHALLQLVRLNTDADVQADVYRRLASLYAGPLANPKRALRCHQEVLRRRPDDEETFDAMVNAYADAGQSERALEMLEQKLGNVRDDDERIDLRLRSARLQAMSTGTRDAAEQTFTDLLARWPADERVLRAAGTYYMETDREQTVRDWRGRLLAQQRTQLRETTSDPTGLLAIGILSEVLGDHALAKLTACVRTLLETGSARFDSTAGRATSRHLDNLLAPTEISSALRILLMQTRGILDQALEVNLAPLNPRQITNERVRTAFEVKARAMGSSLPELFVTSKEPSLALVTGNPSRIVLGTYWVERAAPGVLDFLAWRCLKADQARVGLFTQLDEDRMATVLLAFLSCFVEVRVAPPIRTLYETTRLRVSQRLPKTLDDDLPVLALEVLTSYREAQPDLANAVRRWINRCALLACGNPTAAMTALAVLDGTLNVEHTQPELTQLMQSPHAKDLLDFMLDEAFVKAFEQSS